MTDHSDLIARVPEFNKELFDLNGEAFVSAEVAANIIEAQAREIAELRKGVERGLIFIENAGNILAAGVGCDRKRCPCNAHRDLTGFMIAASRGAALISKALGPE